MRCDEIQLRIIWYNILYYNILCYETIFRQSPQLGVLEYMSIFFYSHVRILISNTKYGWSGRMAE
jgi:hypothetical protein